jgi:hypothetical protein
MADVQNYISENRGIIGTIALLAVLIAVLYVVYSYLYPADDPTYTSFLKGEHDARKPVHVHHKVPSIYTGGDFTFSFWVYVDDFNYKAGSPKFLFAISPDSPAPTSTSPLVGMLSAMTNGLMVRANTVLQTAGAPPQNPSAPTATAATSGAGPDITIESQMQAVLNQQTSTTMFQSTIDTPCDVKDMPLQRWVCITIVSSGRILDVYMDGRLTRSCVLDNVVNVPKGKLRLRLAEFGGFGGRYASVQMWNQQLTPDVIYGIYQMGPTQGDHNIFTDVAKYLNLNVSFTGSAPGQPIPSQASADPFSQLYGAAQGDYAKASSQAQNLMSRF